MWTTGRTCTRSGAGSGVVFPLPVGLPLTVYENVAFAPKLRGIKKKAALGRGGGAVPAESGPVG